MTAEDLPLKDYIDMKALSNTDYSVGLLLSLKLLIANLTINEKMNTQGYIEALKTSISELEKIDINPTVLVAPKSILTDLEELVGKLDKIKQGEEANNGE